MNKPKSTIGAVPDLAAMDALVSGQPKSNDNRTTGPAAAAVSQAPAGATSEGTTVMTTRLPISFHKRLKVHTAQTGESLQDFTMRALDAMLNSEQQAS